MCAGDAENPCLLCKYAVHYHSGGMCKKASLKTQQPKKSHIGYIGRERFLAFVIKGGEKTVCTLIIRLCGLCRFALPLGEFQRKSKSRQRRHFRFQLIIVVLMVWFCCNCLVGNFALQVSHNCTCFEMCAVQAQSKTPELTVNQKGFSAATLTPWHLCLSCKFIHISI